MGQTWDHGVPGPEYWREVLRVAKPGAHLVAFGGPRTFHRLASAIEDAGWEIRDCLMWVFGSSMPKSLNVSKALDKAAGAEREVIGTARGKGGANANIRARPNGNDNPAAKSCGAYTQGAKQIDIEIPVTAPASELARIYDGYGTAIKPAHEPILLCRKPLAGTVAQTVQRYGTGCLNIDGTRVSVSDADAKAMERCNTAGSWRMKKSPGLNDSSTFERKSSSGALNTAQGRWPPNLLLLHTLDCADECADDCPVALMDRQSGVGKSPRNATYANGGSHWFNHSEGKYKKNEYGDVGGASRFFPRFRYNPKVSRKERDGCPHPTMKPIAVVEWLLTLIAPPPDRPQGIPVVLDPFMGSGTTGVAARNLGLDFIGIEREPEYHGFATQRIKGGADPGA